MSLKFSDRLSQSPSPVRGVGEITGEEFFRLALSLGGSPETYGDVIVYLKSLLQADSADKTADFTLAAADMGGILYVAITGSPPADITCTIPKFASVPIPVKSVVNLVLENDGGASPANKLIVSAVDGDVTLNGSAGGSVNVEGNWAAVSLHHRSQNVWTAVGAIS